MGDMGDYWRDVKPILRERKAKRQRQAPRAIEKLHDSGLTVQRLSYHHFRVTGKNRVTYDYWPSTGLWIGKDGSRGYNIDKLLLIAAPPAGRTA